MKFIESIPACFSNHGTGNQVRCTLSWSIPVHPYWLGLCYPKCIYCFSGWFGFLLVTLWLFVLWRIRKKSILWLCAFYFFCRFHFKHFRCIFESCNMVDSLSAWSGIILVCNGSFHYIVSVWVFFKLWDHMGLCFWCIRFLFSQFSFLATEFLLGRRYLSFLFCLVHLLEFLWVWLHDSHHKWLYIGQCIWLGCILNLGFFLVHLLKFFLVWTPNWHPWRYF